MMARRKKPMWRVKSRISSESFTQLLRAPSTCVDDSFYGGNMYQCPDVGYTVLRELTIVFWVYFGG
jgi:hypothetical protein